MKTINLILSISACITLCSTESAFAVPVSASMNLQANATTTGGANAVNTSTDSWGTLLSPLSVLVNATATDPTGTSLSAFGSGNSSWAPDGLSGSINFTNYGWEGSGTTGLATLNGQTDWSYTFVADSNGQFDMNYNVSAAGYAFGLWGWTITMNGIDLLTLVNASDPTMSGSVSDGLLAGDTYTVTLHNNANINGASVAESMNGAFDWAIAPSNDVPEPTSIALASLGLLGLFASRRRKN